MADTNLNGTRAPDDSDTNTARQGKVRQESDVKETLAENIARYRQKLGLSRAALAEKVGVSEISIGQYERCARTPSIEILCRISSALEVSVDTLLGTADRLREMFFVLFMLGFDVKENEEGGITIFKRQLNKTVRIETPIHSMRVSRAKENEQIKILAESVKRLGINIKYPDDEKDFVAEFSGADARIRFELFFESLKIFFERIVGVECFVTQMAIEAATKKSITIPDLALIDKRALRGDVN